MLSTHVPVLLHSALELLAVRSDGIYVDATFGAGGHSRAILAQLRPHGRLIVLDADPRALSEAQQLNDPRVTFVQANFRELSRVLDDCGIARVDGVLFDLGVSSMQLDAPHRGFGVAADAPLDMRMDPTREPSAFEILATASEAELAQIFFEYGEERAAKRIARAIVARRARNQLPQTAAEFAAFVSGVVHRSGRRERIHPATRVFQALRIAVNDELGALREGLTAAVDRLREGGRVVAISFHSLEDRIVKERFRDDERLDVLTKRPIRPDDEEIARNRRARSAKLRAAIRKADQ